MSTYARNVDIKRLTSYMLTSLPLKLYVACLLYVDIDMIYVDILCICRQRHLMSTYARNVDMKKLTSVYVNIAPSPSYMLHVAFMSTLILLSLRLSA